MAGMFPIPLYVCASEKNLHPRKTGNIPAIPAIPPKLGDALLFHSVGYGVFAVQLAG
jgi:hypothetical protein